MKKISLTNGGFAIVDDDNFDEIIKYSWQNNGVGYATRGGGRGKTIRMHRSIMDVSDPKIHIDHINMDKLDNRKCNLRLSNPSLNHANMAKQKNRSSKYKGVSWDKWTNSWKVKVRCNYKIYNIGRSNDEVEAAKMYDKKAKELFGNFARLNFSNVK
jgi:hypothetical protein